MRKNERSRFDMVEFGEQLRKAREAKGMTQQSLAEQLYVTRQSVSRWKCGLSVPDSDMLLSLSEVLETLVSILLGENVTESEADDLKAISAKLEVINL